MNFEAAWRAFAEDANNAAKRELGSRKIGKNKNYGVTKRRALQRSLTFTAQGKRDRRRVTFFAEGDPGAYALFIHDGVNGTEQNRGSKMRFKKQPPRSAMLEWIKNKPIKVRDPEKNKWVKATDSRKNSLAFVLARAIKRRGIHGLRYYETTVPKVLDKHIPVLADIALKEVGGDLSAHFDQLGKRKI